MSTEKPEKVPCHTLDTQGSPARQPISSPGAHTFNNQLPTKTPAQPSASSNVSGISFATPPPRSNQPPTGNTEIPEPILPMGDSPFACSTRSYPSTPPQHPPTDTYTTSSELPASPLGRSRRRSRTCSYVTDDGQSPWFSTIRSEKVELVMKNTNFVLGALDTE